MAGLGREDEAKATAERSLAIIDKHLELYPNDVRAVYMSAGSSWIARRDREDALRRLRRAMEMDPDSQSVRYNVACTYAMLGMADEAMDVLEHNIAAGWGQRSWVEHDPDWRAVHGHPRFRELLDRMNR